MFYNCCNLGEINLCYFDMINNVNTYKMFDLCNQLRKVKINKIYFDFFEKICNTDIIISADLDLEKKMDEILSKKAPNSLLDAISEKCITPIFRVKEETKLHLKEFELEDEYMFQILNNFSSKTKIIFNLKKDKDSINNCISKIYGRSKIGCYLRILRDDTIEDIFCYLNGKLELLKNIFSFENNDLFTCGLDTFHHNFEFR